MAKSERASMHAVLAAFMGRIEGGASHEDAVLSVARMFANDPWTVVGQVGALARCTLSVAPHDLGLNEGLQIRKCGGRASVWDVRAGSRYPVLKNVRRRDRGAFDTPRVMAQRVAKDAIAASRRGHATGLDPACGSGALLLALRELGVSELNGFDVEPLVLQVAQVALPLARLTFQDAFQGGETADVVVGNPPFVRSERQTTELRREMRERFPWLSGRFDLSVPFAAQAASFCRKGGGLGLIVPSALLVQPYGRPLRERWLRESQLKTVGPPESFPGVAVAVSIVSMTVGLGAGPVPPHGISPERVLALPLCPLGTPLTDADIRLIQQVREKSVPLGSVCLVDTGVVAHWPGGSRESLLFDGPGSGRVPYADAKEFFDGSHRWLSYLPEKMHRAKTRTLFEEPKIVIQRIRGNRALKAAVDRRGLYLGHTCTLVQPRDPRIDLDHLLRLIQSPLVEAVMNIERGRSLDLYPREVAAFPIPKRWLAQPSLGFESALGLTADAQKRLLTWVLS